MPDRSESTTAARRTDADAEGRTDAEIEGRENKAGAGTISGDEADVYRGWTSQQGPEPEPLPSTGPQKFVEEQLPMEPPEGSPFMRVQVPEHQMAESIEELDPADQVRVGNPDYASPLGVTANPEGAHIPGESRDNEIIRAAPEGGSEAEAAARSGDVAAQNEEDRRVRTSGGTQRGAEPTGVELTSETDADAGADDDDESDLSSMTKAELVDMAREQGLEGYSSMNKDELVQALGG